MEKRMWRYLTILLFPLVLSAQSATNERDLEVAKPADSASTTPAGVPNGYALIVGISKYQNLDASQNLAFPETDAEAIYRVLISREGGAFPADHVHLLKGSQASIANIRHELEDWLPSVAQPADRVIVYFAGHGIVKNGRGYLAAWDVRLANLENTSYPMAALGDVMANKVKARWKVLLADACHSGKINSESSNERVDAELRSLPGSFLTLTATTERESSYEDPKLSTGFGFFTYYLVQAFNGHADGYADANCDGRITADELIEYVRSQVRQYAKEQGVSQTPTARGDYDPAMVLGVSFRCLNTTPNSPQTLGTAKLTVNMDDVRIYIDGRLLEGALSKGRILTQPGLTPGLHQFEAVHDGYEPDRQEILIVPGQEVSVTFRIRYQKEVKKAALDLNRKGEDLLSSHQSTLNSLTARRSQKKEDLIKARGYFESALREDPKFSEAAFHLGQTNQLLSDRAGSMRAYKQALEIDPNYVEAQVQYAAILIEDGDVDEAIRRLTEASRFDRLNDQVYSFLARAYWDKGKWDLCVDNANHAIQINPTNHQAYLWKADALRQQGELEKNPKQKASLYEAARENYLKLLSLTNFDSTPPLEWVAFHFIGFGAGSRRHVDREASFDATRVAGFLGVCLSDQNLGNLIHAREYCQRAIKQDPTDPIAYFVFANINRDLYNKNHRCDDLNTAHDNYVKMIKLNADLDESTNARNYIEQIQGFLLQNLCL
jgi:tetratricopeptide (TPR) repeat protein